MVEPAVDYLHQRYFINIAEEKRINQLDIFLVENSVHQRQSIIVHQLNNALLTDIAPHFDAHLNSHKGQNLAENVA